MIEWQKLCLFKCTFVDFCSVRKTYVSKNGNENKQIFTIYKFSRPQEYISYILVLKDYTYIVHVIVTRLTQFPFKFPLSLSFINSCCFAIQLYKSSPVFIGLVG